MKVEMKLMNTDLPNRNGRIFPSSSYEEMQKWISEHTEEMLNEHKITIGEYNPYESYHPTVLIDQPVFLPTLDGISISKGDNIEFEKLTYLIPRGYHNIRLSSNIIESCGGFKPGTLYYNQCDISLSLLPYFYKAWVRGAGKNYYKEKFENEYRKFIEENRFKGIKTITSFRPLSISGIPCAKSHGNNIKYATRRSFDDMGK